MMPPVFDPATFDAVDMTETFTLEERIESGEAILAAMLAEIAGRHLALETMEDAARNLVLALDELRAEQARRAGRLQ